MGNSTVSFFSMLKKTFDSINHNILLNKMKKRFGIFSIDLRWFEWYLSSREHQCSINAQLSVSIAQMFIFM